MSRSEWLWGAQTRKLFTQLGLAWEVIPGLNGQNLGSSPGDAYYVGSTQAVRLDPQAWLPWVVHEAAHFMVCQQDHPEYLGEDNYGYEQEGENRLAELIHDEGLASDLTVALLVRLHLPWKRAAYELSIEPRWSALEGMSPRHVPSVGVGGQFIRLGSRRYWDSVKQRVLDSSAPYLTLLEKV